MPRGNRRVTLRPADCPGYGTRLMAWEIGPGRNCLGKSDQEEGEVKA